MVNVTVLTHIDKLIQSYRYVKFGSKGPRAVKIWVGRAAQLQAKLPSFEFEFAQT